VPAAVYVVSLVQLEQIQSHALNILFVKPHCEMATFVSVYPGEHDVHGL